MISPGDVSRFDSVSNGYHVYYWVLGMYLWFVHRVKLMINRVILPVLVLVVS